MMDRHDDNIHNMKIVLKRARYVSVFQLSTNNNIFNGNNVSQAFLTIIKPHRILRSYLSNLHPTLSLKKLMDQLAKNRYSH